MSDDSSPSNPFATLARSAAIADTARGYSDLTEQFGEQIGKTQRELLSEFAEEYTAAQGVLMTDVAEEFSEAHRQRMEEFSQRIAASNIGQMSELAEKLGSQLNTFEILSSVLDAVETPTYDAIAGLDTVEIEPAVAPGLAQPRPSPQPQQIELSPVEWVDAGLESGLLVECDECGHIVYYDNSHKFARIEDEGLLCGKCRDSDRGVQ